MMQDTATTLRGRIGSDPIMKHVKDTCVTTFRMAITRWRFASEARPGAASYVEEGAHWYTIETWDTLAQNVFRSCRKGDPVIVVARPVPNGWVDAAGEVRSSIVFRACALGHDLARGYARFTKNQVISLAEPSAGTADDPFSTRPGQPGEIPTDAQENTHGADGKDTSEADQVEEGAGESADGADAPSRRADGRAGESAGAAQPGERDVRAPGAPAKDSDLLPAEDAPAEPVAAIAGTPGARFDYGVTRSSRGTEVLASAITT